MMGHSRWTAAARELARQFWGTDPGFTLVMTSLGALGAAFFRGGLVRKVVTAYSGNSFPTYTPNPIFRQAYESGEVEVEHWSILTLGQRLEAAARGLPATVTGSLVGSSMADNDAFTVVDSPFGPLGLLEPLAPDVALVPRRRGRPGRQPRVLRTVARRAVGRLGGPAGRGGDGRARCSTTSRASGTGSASRPIVSWPSSRRPTAPTRAAATPRDCPCAATARTSRTGARRPTPRRATSSTLRRAMGCWVPATHAEYLARVGEEQLLWLEGAVRPDVVEGRRRRHPDRRGRRGDEVGAGGASAPARSNGGGRPVGADAVLAGAGVANLAAWVAVGRARAARQQGGAHRRARALGLPADSGRPVHLQPAGVPVDALPLGRLGGPRAW